MQIYGTGRKIRAIATYMVAVSVAGFGTFLCVVKEGAFPDSLTTFVYLSLAIIGQHLSVTFPDGNSIALVRPCCVCSPMGVRTPGSHSSAK